MDLHAAYLNRRQAELDELDAEFKTLELKADTVKTSQGVQLYGDLQDLRTRLADVRHKLGELQDSESKHWQEGQEKLEGTWKVMQSVLKRTQRRFG